MSKGLLFDACVVNAACNHAVSVEQLLCSLDTLLTMVAFGERSGLVIVIEDAEIVLESLGLIADIYCISGDKAAYALSYFYDSISDNRSGLINCIKERIYEKEFHAAIMKANCKHMNQSI